MKTRICQRCKSRPPKTQHFNCKWCDPCRKALLKAPAHGLDQQQVATALRLRGKKTKEEIAEIIGSSRSAVIRLGRDLKLTFSTHLYQKNPSLVQEICDYYAEHGKLETIRRYPTIRIRSVVERYNKTKRQVRWTEQEMRLAVQMAGLVKADTQAKIFNRPGAHAGSVRALWSKRLSGGSRYIHGMSHDNAKHLVRASCPLIHRNGWRLYLWCDMKHHFRAGTAEFIRDAIRTMAEFQCWIFGTRQPRRKIMEILNQHG